MGVIGCVSLDPNPHVTVAVRPGGAARGTPARPDGSRSSYVRSTTRRESIETVPRAFNPEHN